MLSQPVYRRLEKRRQAEEVLAAGIDGLESCPFCEYCEVPAESDPLFRCRNPECSKVSSSATRSTMCPRCRGNTFSRRSVKPLDLTNLRRTTATGR